MAVSLAWVRRRRAAGAVAATAAILAATAGAARANPPQPSPAIANLAQGRPLPTLLATTGETQVPLRVVMTGALPGYGNLQVVAPAGTEFPDVYNPTSVLPPSGSACAEQTPTLVTCSLDAYEYQNWNTLYVRLRVTDPTAALTGGTATLTTSWQGQSPITIPLRFAFQRPVKATPMISLPVGVATVPVAAAGALVYLRRRRIREASVFGV